MISLRKFLALFCGGLLLGPRFGSAQTASSSVSPPANDIESISFNDDDFYVRRVNPHVEKLRIFLKDPSGKPFKTFQALSQYLETKQETLLFGANAGMFEDDRSPVGLLIENGEVMHPLNTREAHGNFYLKPNGVFYIDQQHNPHVVETSQFRQLEHTALLATQSGPLLLEKGRMHPAFKQDSKNKLIRSGVGVTPKGKIVLALSKGPVSFYDFSEFFKAQGCPDALFLDGSISAFYSPSRVTPKAVEDFGPMLAIVGKKS